MVLLNLLATIAIIFFTTASAMAAPRRPEPTPYHPRRSRPRPDETSAPVHYLTKEDLAPFRNITSLPAYMPIGHNSSFTRTDNTSISPHELVGGVDERVLWTDQTWPYSCSGRLTISNHFCSGVLVGPRLLLTAKHCTRGFPLGTFAPSYDLGNRLGSVDMVKYYQTALAEPDDGPVGPNYCKAKEDWALVSLKEEIGITLGYWAVKAIDLNQDLHQPKFMFIGYPGDRDGGQRPYKQERINCKRADACNGFYPMDTNGWGYPGQSGGPAFLIGADTRPIAYGATSIGDDDFMLFAGGNEMVNAIANVNYMLSQQNPPSGSGSSH